MGESDPDLREIGFNNEVQQGPRSLHVQTEVVIRGQTILRTTVLHRGAIVHVSSYPFDLKRPLEECRRIARTFHERIVDRVASGEIS